MPIYEYACPTCGKEFEVLQRFSDEPVRVCPTCGADQVRKKISATSFVLKGGGWYKDHYGLKSGGSSEGKEGKGDAPAAAAAPTSAPAPAPAPAPSSTPSSTPSSGGSS